MGSKKWFKQAECKGYQDVPPKIKQKSKARSNMGSGFFHNNRL
jgi:hypothetical protein